MTTINLTLEPNDHGKHIYHPGQTLKGMAILTLSRTKKSKGFYINVFGRARTYWTKQVQGRYAQTQLYEDIEVYINSDIYLFGQKDGPTIDLQPGTHTYNFSYVLSEKLPSSIHLKYGTITYFIEAVLDIPLMVNNNFKIPFTVARCDDLNVYRNLREPVKIVETKNFFPFASPPNIQSDPNPICITVMLPCSGFVANQIVSMTVLYQNDIDTNVIGTRVTFNQKIQFRSSTIPQIKIEEYKLVEVRAEGVDSKQSKSISIDFKIPNVVDSNRKFCRIITVSYWIEVEGDLGREHASLKVKIPITIGNIPIRSDDQSSATNSIEASAPPLETFQPLLLPIVQPSAPVLEQLDDLPPSYDEAMKMIHF